PDFFDVSVDSMPVFQTTINSVSAGATYGGDNIGSGLVQRGFTSLWFDRAFDMNSEAILQNIPYTASTLTVSWFASGSGWQGVTTSRGPSITCEFPSMARLLPFPSPAPTPCWAAWASPGLPSCNESVHADVQAIRTNRLQP